MGGETAELVAASFLGWTPVTVRPIAVGLCGRRTVTQVSATKIDSLWRKAHVVVRVVTGGHLVWRGTHT